MRVLMLATWLTLGPSVTNAADRCASDDLAIKACVKQDLIDNNIIINGTLVDPGLQKTKLAGDLCQLDCNAHSSAFEAKWAKFRTPQK